MSMVKMARARLEEQWQNHKNNCYKCEQVDVSKTSSLAHCCLTGAAMFKDLMQSRNSAKRKRDLWPV